MTVKEMKKILSEFDEKKEISIFQCENGMNYPITNIYKDDMSEDIYIDLDINRGASI